MPSSPKRLSHLGKRQSGFDYSADFTKINFRDRPDLYRIGIGEQGVLLVEPYKSEILPFWRFKTKDIAEKSGKKILSLFNAYKKKKDFVGMDMARKFLQMGYTRSRRYANHASGKKYDSNPQKASDGKAESALRTKIRPQSADWSTNEKAQAARVFYGYYLQAREDAVYKKLRHEHKAKYENKKSR